MKVLVTGGLGNIGSAVVRTLLEDGVSVRVFEQATRPNLRKAADAAERVAKAAARAAVTAAKAAVGEARRLGKAVGLKGRSNANGQAAEAAADTFREHARRLRGLEVAWGDLGDGTGLREAVEGCDAVVHMAFIIPPTSERRTEWARNINVGGTRRLLDACLAGGRNPRVVFASSISVYGNSQGKTPPRRVGDEVGPIDAYGKMKIECEDMLKESGLPLDDPARRGRADHRLAAHRPDHVRHSIDRQDRVRAPGGRGVRVREGGAARGNGRSDDADRRRRPVPDDAI